MGLKTDLRCNAINCVLPEMTTCYFLATVKPRIEFTPHIFQHFTSHAHKYRYFLTQVNINYQQFKLCDHGRQRNHKLRNKIYSIMKWFGNRGKLFVYRVSHVRINTKQARIGLTKMLTFNQIYLYTKLRSY